MSDLGFKLILIAWSAAALVLWVPFPYLFTHLTRILRTAWEQRVLTMQIKRQIALQPRAEVSSLPTQT